MKLKTKYQNAHISCAFRNQVEQELAFEDHKSRKHWPDSAHNVILKNQACSLALDIFQIDEDGNARFSLPWYTLIHQSNLDDHMPLLWGGNYLHFKDYDHFEFVPNALHPLVS